MRVVIDIGREEALLGPLIAPIARAGSRGELRIGGPSGTCLRPLTFGERTTEAVRALSTPTPRDTLCPGILRAATVTDGDGDNNVAQVLALHLAGAGSDAPGFAESALLVARAAGWDPATLADAEAAEVDRLALHLAPPAVDSGWTRL